MGPGKWKTSWEITNRAYFMCYGVMLGTFAFVSILSRYRFRYYLLYKVLVYIKISICVCRNGSARHLASGSMDKTVRIWDTILGQTLRILSSHTEAVSALRWGGTGLIYSGSRDKTIKVWRSVDVCNTIFVFR